MFSRQNTAPVPERIESAAERRVAESTPERQEAIRAIQRGRPLDAERNETRKVRRLIHVTGVAPAEAEAMASYTASPRQIGLAGDPQLGAERILGVSADFVGVAFLDLARAAARTVGRVTLGDGNPWGSGFLVAPGLFLTNNHVIASAAQARDRFVQFEYELDTQRRQKTPTQFRFAPEALFMTNGEDDLDFTLIAVGERVAGTRALTDLGYCLLSDSSDRHTIGEYVNIVQHPDGRYKEIVLRENRIVWRSENVLHYIADTEPGSSGSPVFNDQWEPVALHHWGGPHRDLVDADGRPLDKEINEGLRISAVVRAVRAGHGLQGSNRRLVERAVEEWSREARTSGPIVDDGPRSDAVAPQAVNPQVDAAGRVTWTIPLTVTVGLGGIPVQPPSTSAASTIPPSSPPTQQSDASRDLEAIHIDPNYGNRRGYDADFLPGFWVPLPKWTKQHHPAPRTDSSGSNTKYVLEYEHFSIVLNRKRRMAIFTAVNIDGAEALRVNRDTGKVTGRAEASERWYRDPRVADDHQSNQSLYSNQRPTRLFDRGHLVRREDPNWGTNDSAERANADTFHFTNCTPQASNFNQKAQYWQGIENYILNNARAEDSKVTVFTGPVFGDNDPKYRDVKVPRQFWKILVRVENGELLATALLADQSSMLNNLPEHAGRIDEDALASARPESFADLGDVAQYQVTVAEIEQLTGLDFGELRQHDTAESEGESLSQRSLLECFSDIHFRKEKCPMGRPERHP